MALTLDVITPRKGPALCTSFSTCRVAELLKRRPALASVPSMPITEGGCEQLVRFGIDIISAVVCCL